MIRAEESGSLWLKLKRKMDTSELCLNSSIVQSGMNSTARRTPENVIFTQVYFGFGVVIDVVSLILFYLFKRKFERTRIRPTLLVVMSVLGSLAQMSYGSMITIARGTYPCWIGILLIILIVPLVSASIIGRLLLFLYLSRFSEGAIKQMGSTGALERDRARAPHSGLLHTYLVAFQAVFMSQKRERTQAEIQQELYDLRFLISRRGVFFTMFIFVLPFLILALSVMASNPVYLYCFDCGVSIAETIAVLTVGVIIIVVGMVTWGRTRRLKDVWGLSAEAFWCLIWALLALIGFILATFADREVFETYSHQFLLSLGLWLVVMQQSVVQLALGWWETYRERRTTVNSIPSSSTSQVSRSSSILGNLDLILEDETWSKAFETHLAAEFGLESLLFLKDAMKWKHNFYDSSDSARISRAKRIERIYIDDNGLFTINVPDQISRDIHATIRESNEKGVCVALFDEAIAEVTTLLNTGAVQRFLSKAKPNQEPSSDPESAKLPQHNQVSETAVCDPS